MAVQSPCEILSNGRDYACIPILRRYAQQAVVINKSDIETMTITTPTDENCEYNVTFSLKEGKTGYLFRGGDGASTFKGYFDKTNNETNGYPQYIHNVQMLMAGVDEATKCVLASLDKGSYVVALQFGETIEVYGIRNGLTTGDYTYDPQETGGGAALILSSREVSPEPELPLIYVSETPGSEVADFDDLFANPEPSV